MPQSVFAYRITGDGRSCPILRAADPWPPPGEWTPEVSVRFRTGVTSEPTSGYFGALPHQLRTWLVGSHLWVCEFRGVVIRDADLAGTRARLIRQVESWNPQTARLYACDVAERVLHLAGDPRSRRAVDTARRHAEGKAGADELHQAGRQARRAVIEMAGSGIAFSCRDDADAVAYLRRVHAEAVAAGRGITAPYARLCAAADAATAALADEHFWPHLAPSATGGLAFLALLAASLPTTAENEWQRRHLFTLLGPSAELPAAPPAPPRHAPGPYAQLGARALGLVSR